MKTCFFLVTGCLHAIWIGFRKWGSTDISWPESLNSRDVEGRMKRLAVDCRALPLALVVAFAGLWVVEVLWEGLLGG